MIQMAKDLFYLIDTIFRLIFLPFDFIFLNIIWLFYMDLYNDKYTYKQFISLAWQKVNERKIIFKD